MPAPLGHFEVLAAILLVGIPCLLSFFLNLGIERPVLISSSRTVIQLLLLGYALTWIFQFNTPLTFSLVFLFMVAVAAVTSVKRVKKKFHGILQSSFVTLLVSTIFTGAYTLMISIPQKPWYDVTQSIPLMGMILGNSLTGVSLALNQFLKEVAIHKNAIEGHLGQGASRMEALRPLIGDAIHTGLTPLLNSMVVVGLVSIPGMMTGQILSGQSPLEAAKYQINIMMMICCSSTLSIFGIIFWNYFRLFSSEHRFNEKMLYEISQ